VKKSELSNLIDDYVKKKEGKILVLPEDPRIHLGELNTTIRPNKKRQNTKNYDYSTSDYPTKMEY
jgi:hypothetical protein